MSILFIAALVLFLGFLLAFALLLAGYWAAPEQIKQHFLAFARRRLEGFWLTMAQTKQRIIAFARKKPAPHVTFRAWVESDLGGHPDLQAWLLSLSDSGLKALNGRLEKYTADLKIELSWLTEHHIDVAPAVREAAKTVVAAYLDGCRCAFRQRTEIALFSQYHQLVADPADSRHIELRRKLFNRLTALGLIRPLPANELIMASELERQTLAANAIREAAAKDWDTFAKLFIELLAGGAEQPPADQAA